MFIDAAALELVGREKEKVLKKWHEIANSWV